MADVLYADVGNADVGNARINVKLEALLIAVISGQVKLFFGMYKVGAYLYCSKTADKSY